MLSFDPAWSFVFDLAVCAAMIWLAVAVSKRGLSAARTPLLGAAVLLCIPILIFGKLWSLIASLVVVPLLVVYSYRDTEQPLPRNARLLLASTRIVVFALVILCLLRPKLAFQEVDVHRACAVVLADVSSSMEGKDCPPEGARFDALKAVLKDNADAVRKLEQKCDYRFATFAEGFRRDAQLPQKPAGRRTNLADAFAGVTRDLGGAKAVGILLLSDGRNNGVGDAVAAARRLGVPVFAVCLGAEQGSPAFTDSLIQNVDCPERVFVKNTATVTIRVAYAGAPATSMVDVTLTAENEKIGSRRIPMPAPGATADVEFEYLPQTEGLKKLVASVTPAENDANLHNNTREIFVRASETALKVLFIEGEVRWEYKFLRRAIAGAENIDLVSVNAFLLDESDQTQLLPADEQQWALLTLIILGDIPASRFTPAQLERIKKFVADGGALLMLGGFSTLGPGGYGDTPIAKILPVDINKEDAQKLDALRVVPTEDGLAHNILAFGSADETNKVWQSLPPLSGYTRVSGVKPAARVLVKTPDDAPVLAVQEYERGRTAVFAADTTWRWIFNEGKFARYHKAFWRQFVLWLTKSGYGGVGGGIWVETDRLRYLTGEVPTVTVRASGDKLENSDITADIEGPDGKLCIVVGKGPGQYVLNLPKPVKISGTYEVAASTTPQGGKKLQAATKFVVQELDIENEEPGADPQLLAAIAKATGGRAYRRGEARQAFDALLESDSASKVFRQTFKGLWDNAFIYIALCALLCTEWIVRKRKGLA